MNKIKTIGMITVLIISILLSGCVDQTNVTPNVTPNITPNITVIQTVTAIPTIIPTIITPDTTTEKTNSVVVNTTYLGYDEFDGKLDIQVNITTSEIGKLTYRENYYAIDSYGKPILYNSRTYFDSEINSTDIRFEIGRPIDRRGGAYSQIEIVTILNDNKSSQWYDLNDDWN